MNFLVYLLILRYFLQVMMKIDQINRRILQELEQNGRISNTDLADKVGLSASACLRRVQELERQDIIKGYRAVINRAAMGCELVIFVTVGLSRHQQKDQKTFENAMKHAPEVRECHTVTGSIEYLLRVEVADIAAYKVFHDDVLGQVPQVGSIITHITIESSKDERA